MADEASGKTRTSTTALVALVALVVVVLWRIGTVTSKAERRLKEIRATGILDPILIEAEMTGDLKERIRLAIERTPEGAQYWGTWIVEEKEFWIYVRLE